MKNLNRPTALFKITIITTVLKSESKLESENDRMLYKTLYEFKDLLKKKNLPEKIGDKDVLIYVVERLQILKNVIKRLQREITISEGERTDRLAYINPELGALLALLTVEYWEAAKMLIN